MAARCCTEGRADVGDGAPRRHADRYLEATGPAQLPYGLRAKDRIERHDPTPDRATGGPSHTFLAAALQLMNDHPPGLGTQLGGDTGRA